MFQQPGTTIFGCKNLASTALSWPNGPLTEQMLKPLLRSRASRAIPQMMYMWLIAQTTSSRNSRVMEHSSQNGAPAVRVRGSSDVCSSDRNSLLQLPQAD